MLKNYTKIEVEDLLGDKHYLSDEEERHRLDGPAVENSRGTKFWFINGKDHRNIDPADDYSGVEKLWWFKGEKHRIGDSYNSYSKLWFIHGKRYTKKEYFNEVWDI